jgi:hypothetical protein
MQKDHIIKRILEKKEKKLQRKNNVDFKSEYFPIRLNIYLLLLVSCDLYFKGYLKIW